MHISENLVPIERDGQRVLLTSQFAQGYGTTSEVISNNYNRNKARYEEGKHFFLLEGDALKEFKATHQIDDQLKFATKLYLWTEKGALLHAKSLNTEQAWEVYGELVETYFKAQDMVAKLNQLSPQLQLLIQMETEQRRQAQALEAVNRRVDGIREVVALNPHSWREDCRGFLAKIAQARGGGGAYQEVNAEVYKLVDQRARVSLETRLTYKRRRMADEGVCKSKRDRLSKVDVISDDPKLIEIYTAIVKEMAVKHGVTVEMEV